MSVRINSEVVFFFMLLEGKMNSSPEVCVFVESAVLSSLLKSPEL